MKLAGNNHFNLARRGCAGVAGDSVRGIPGGYDDDEQTRWQHQLVIVQYKEAEQLWYHSD